MSICLEEWLRLICKARDRCFLPNEMCSQLVLLRWAAMKRYLLLLVAFSLLAGRTSAVSAQIGAPDPDSPEAKQARLAWFKEAKYGLFTHWGLYAVAAGEWKGKPIAGLGEWIMNRAHIPVQEYEQLAKQWNPVKFDADAWVQLAQDAGMKYIVITSKHHDGFAMFDSKVSRYNVVAATPFHRDILKGLATACQNRGIPLGFYYSQSQDWHEPGGAGNDWDFGADQGPDKKELKDYDGYLRGKAEPQVRELLTGYGPVALIWFDTPRMMTRERGQRFVDLVRSLQPKTLIDGRLGVAGDYVSTGDNFIAGPTPWGEEFGEPTSRGTKDLRGSDLFLAHNEWRATTRPGKVYVTLFVEPRLPFTLPPMRNAVKRAYRLADGAPVEVKTDGGR